MVEAKSINIFIVTMGCAKNSVDSEHMAGYLSTAGHQISTTLAKAQAAIVNTCGFIQPAIEENIDTILQLIEYKKSGQLNCLIVTGCLSQRYQGDLAVELPEVDGFVGTGEYHRIATILDEAVRGQKPQSFHLADCFDQHMPRLQIEHGASAYLKIAEGCPRQCSYCIIPSLRGPLHSRNMAEIIQEAKMLTDQGVKELILVAQDTTAYGQDLSGKPMLSQLLTDLGQIPQLHWVRFLYAYPDLIDDRLLETMASESKVCAYLDLPLQHVSGKILKSMGRRGDTAEYLRLIQKIRSYLPKAALHSTFILGYPGETAAEFAELLEFIDEVKFNQLSVFQFYPEEGTRAAALPDQIQMDIARDRVQRLTTLQEIISTERNQQRIGNLEEILVEGIQPEELSFTGRSRQEAPEIDALFSCSVPHTQDLPKTGDFVQVRISSADSQEISALFESKL